MVGSYGFLALAILFGVLGQVVLKTGAQTSGEGLEQFLNPWTICGFGIYFLSAITYILAIKKLPVSLAYPSVSISYGILAIIANVLWNEPLGWQQAAGILLITGGIFVLFRA